MKNIKIVCIVILSLVIFSCSKENSNFDFKIGISQIVSHPALDEARKGFKDELEKEGFKVKYIETNANGDIAALELNSKKLVNQNVDLIYAIATPSAQSAQNATKEIPIVFSAVTDSKAANLVNDNITGMLDIVDMKSQVELLLKVLPNIKKIGFIYNSSEQNSIYQLEELKKISSEYNIDVVEKSATQINEIPQVLENLIASTDAIYTPADNLVASSIKLIADKAKEAKVVTIGAEKSHVDSGILMTVGIDYYELGKLAAKQAIEILKNGKKPSKIEIGKMLDYKQEINQETKKIIGVEF